MATDSMRPQMPGGGAAHKAYRGLRKLIIDGAFAGGAHLREENLAGELGVSRTPVREAIRRLAAEGWVRIVPNQGAFVCEWSAEDVDEVFTLRAMLEGFAAEAAARNATTAQIHELRRLSDEGLERLPCRTSDDIERIADINNRFHKLILTASRQRRTATTVSHLVELPISLRNFHQFGHEDMQRSMGQHHAVAEAIAARDPDWSGNVMRAHVLAGKAVFHARTGTRTEPETLSPEAETPTPQRANGKAKRSTLRAS